MEVKVILTPEEQHILGVDQEEFSDADALHLLFDATERLNRTAEHMDQLRGNVAGQRAQLNRVWHEQTILSGLVDGLGRVANLWSDDSTR